MISKREDIRFECPKCSQPFVVDADGAGLETSCPICHTLVIVPHVSGLHERDYGPGAGAAPMEKRRTNANAVLSRSPMAEPGRGAKFEDGSEFDGRIRALERKLAEAEAEAVRLERTLAAATDEGERMSANAVQSQAERKQYQNERQQLRNELAAEKQSVTAAELQIVALRAELAALAVENDRVRAESTALKQDLEASRERVRAMESQLALKDSEISGARREIHDTEHDLCTANAEIVRLQDEGALYRKNFDEVRTKLATAEPAVAALEEVRRTLTETERERARLAGHCAELEGRNQSLTRDLQESAAGREIAELRASVAELEKERERYRCEAANAISDFQRIDEANRVLKAELTQTRTERETARMAAEAGSKSQLTHDNEVLRGIIARQNTELTARHGELQRLRRARLLMRSLWALAALGFLALVAFAASVMR